MHSFFLLASLLALGPASPTWEELQQVAPPTVSQPPAQVELIIDFVDGQDTDWSIRSAVQSALGGGMLKLNSIHSVDEGMYIVSVPFGAADDIINRLTYNENIETVERNAVYHLFGEPNDPRYNEQWNLKLIGVDKTLGVAQGKGVVVAVIDTGVAYLSRGKFVQVEDLENTEFTEGYDFVNDSPFAMDDHGHGTHVAGTIAQSTNNGKGVAGVAPQATIMPLKVLSRYGSGTVADIADAIRFAADEGAQVINMSLGGGPYSAVLASAVKYARNKGVLVACAAGNTGRGEVEYPAKLPGAFAVSSVGPDGKLAFYSSYGKEIAIAAPGGDKNQGGEASGVLQNTINPSNLSIKDFYGSFQGTSMATPHVAGVAALIIGRGVTDITQVETILRESATPAGDANKYGAGILNAAAAINVATTPFPTTYLPLILAFFATGLFLYKNKLIREKIKSYWILVLSIIMSTTGIFVLRGTFVEGIPVLGHVLTHPVYEWLVPWMSVSILEHSALFFFGLVMFLLSKQAAFPVLVGVGVGSVAHFVCEAAFATPNVIGFGSGVNWVDTAWLASQAALCAVVMVGVWDKYAGKRSAFSGMTTRNDDGVMDENWP